MSVVEQHEVAFTAHDGIEMRASLALPASGKQPRPGVLVIHELLGLNRDIRRIARRFAENGYVALAPDLFHRPGSRALCVVKTMMAMRSGRGVALDDLECARQYLGERSEVDAERLGVAGFCMGGGFALLLATTSWYRAAAPYYGQVAKTADEMRGTCPIVGGYGGRDRVFAPHGRRLKRHLETLGVAHDVEVYDDAGHSYMSQHAESFGKKLSAIGPMKVAYDEAAAEDSWARMLSFFDEHVRDS